VILTAHQPVYLPWLGLFHKIALADCFVSFNQVQYQPKDWNNRNKVKTAQGPKWLSVPVKRKGYLESTIWDIKIDNDKPWGRKHFKTLQFNYAKAKFFGRYIGFFEEVYEKRWDKLVELNEVMLRWFLDMLGIEVRFASAHDYDFQGYKSGLVLNMCQTLGARSYIFGELGRGYADIASFNEAGIEIVFQEYHHPTYDQLHGGFESHLSILDLLFNHGDASLDILMSSNATRASLWHEPSDR